MAFLFGMEFYAYLSIATETQLIVDRSASSELLKINFNVSFPALSCEFATLDVSDALGTKRMNLTKTVRKVPITLNLERVGAAIDDVKKTGPKYDEEGRFDDESNDIDVTVPLTHDNFQATLARYPIVLVNFYAPWCHWCQRLEPTWEAATKEVHDKYPEWDGRIRFAKVDCTTEVDLCRQHFIQGFPSIRVFRKGHDDIYIGGMHEHEAYTGDRTKEALVSFADNLVPSAGQPHRKHADLSSAPKSSGCNLAGFVLVKKVPGTLHFGARTDGHSFDHAWMNMSHVVHSFYFGSRPTVKKYQLLQRLHPAGLSTDWADKLHDQAFVSEHTQSTHEHYLQVVLTTVEPPSGKGGYDAYEYTAHSHTYMSDDVPSAKVTFDLSPLQVLVREARKPLYHFLTTTCAIIGGVFTVAGILDAILYQSLSMLRKKQLGKQGEQAAAAGSSGSSRQRQAAAGSAGEQVHKGWCAASTTTTTSTGSSSSSNSSRDAQQQQDVQHQAAAAAAAGMRSSMQHESGGNGVECHTFVTAHTTVRNLGKTPRGYRGRKYALSERSHHPVGVWRQGVNRV
eukprot:CAMPEP_0202921332 /NCGR_PEP_ID=MMETSP1392-20130828/77335_1 /ASSEMBLY_ACC=CAM_ASM_000868 /TAXON_ID=225041 /ORGANISM="Chlamydomonas chlamydogama, Strain SAG 11-48b" /LENGTH=565 /DNA_ID=CAMNT_0049614897 /DNA_START=237 /DNA_END=1936 /DNA_ORIENTATION=-